MAHTAGSGALAAAVFIYRNWQTTPSLDDEYDYEEYDDDEVEYEDEDTEDDEVNQLLKAIADLDDTYEKGGLEEADYTSQRAHLKADLKALWQ